MARRRKSREGEAHKIGKRILAAWLRAGIKQGMWGLSKSAKVYAEWPLLSEHTSNDAVWFGKPPSFRALVEEDYVPKVILDLCLVDYGKIIAGFEVVNWHPCTPEKIEFLNKLPYDVVEINTAWLLYNHRRMPAEWKIDRAFGEALA